LILAEGGPSKGHLQESLPVPLRTFLGAVYPNPLNPTTTIEFGLDQSMDVRLTIYDIRGREVRTLVHTKLDAGTYRQPWDGCNELGHRVAAGVYVAWFAAGDIRTQKKIALVK
jgi:flagellar hook assembly protein FlgD